MKRPDKGVASRIISALAGMMLLFGASGYVPVNATEIGLNRVNLGWQKPADRQRILDEMKRNGVQSVRLSLSAPVEPSLDAVRIAHEAGLRILLEISLNNRAFYPAGTKRRSALGKSFDAFRLSDLDPERYRIVIREALAKLDSEGIQLVAVEPGNEINWAGYNGDLAVSLRKDSSETGDATKISQGLDRYVDLVRVTHEELQASRLNRDAKLISAGLADMPVSFSRRIGLAIIPAPEWTAQMQQRGLDKLVDAYGIHLYPGGAHTRASRDGLIRDVLSFCGADRAGKPCWITEWGVANKSSTCPIDDNKRTVLIDQARAIIDRDIKAGRVTAAYYYDWDSSTPYSVWRCGSLSAAGKAAIRPVAQ